MDDTAIARIAHEVNREWCAFNGDTSQPRWDDAPEWQRSSAINGVAFHRANPDAGDSASHDSWMAEKVAAGWVHGDVKNPDASPPTHPCIVPFEELPRDQQFKDRLFRTIVHAAIDGEPKDVECASNGIDTGGIRYERIEAMNLASRINPEGCTAAQLINDAKTILDFAQAKDA